MRRLLTTCVLLCIAGLPAAQPLEHHGRGGYVNPHMQGSLPGLFAFVRSRLFSGQWASYDPDVYQVPVAEPAILDDAAKSANAAVTWLGHSTVLIQHQGVNVLTDPILTRRASPASFAGPKRISKPALTLAELPRIDIVVISHDHYDHLDVRTLRGLGETTRFFVPLGLRAWFERIGIEPARVREMDWWDSAEHAATNADVTITATPSQHFSGRGLFDRDRTLWASWALQWDDFTVWFGGDTGYNDVQFKEIGARFETIDLGIIPIGAYKPSALMRLVHVDPREAVLIHQDIGAERSMGVHWGTFVLAAEEVDEPPRELAEAVGAARLPPEEFSTFAVGETRSYERGKL